MTYPSDLNHVIGDIFGDKRPLFDGRTIPRGTFEMTEEDSGGKYRVYLTLHGPVEQYTDGELIFHCGGDIRFGDTVSRYPGSAAVKVWRD